VAADADVTVVVDVLSFTSTLSVAVDAGIAVLPFRWNDATARGFADQQDAVLALGRSEAGPGEISLSPASIRAATPPQRHACALLVRWPARRRSEGGNGTR
jgi:2-phosphosulfolactate phosphatase